MPDQPSKNRKMTVLLSVNAAVILVVGVMITSAIWLNGGVDFRVVGERSDIVEDNVGEMDLLESVTDSDVKPIDYVTGNDDYISTSSHEFDSSEVPAGELWNEGAITIYATPDIDICVGGGLADLGEMYWQTSNPKVIEGFYDSSRSWLGYDN